EHLIGGLMSEFFIRDVSSAKGGFQLWADAFFAEMLTCAKKREFSFAQFTSHVTECGKRIGVTHVVRIAARSDMHADMTRAPNRNYGVGDFQHQPRAIF